MLIDCKNVHADLSIYVTLVSEHCLVIFLVSTSCQYLGISKAKQSKMFGVQLFKALLA